MVPETKIEKCYRRTSIHHPKDDSAYWRSQPYAVRLRALEDIRQEYHRWRYHAEPRLQRVYTIAKR